MDTAHRFEEALLDDLEETAREHAVKQAEVDSKAKERASGGLHRIATGQTPYDEVKAILEQKKNKTAAQVVNEHRARQLLRKIAGRDHELVDHFLKTTG
jgi:hypothetical protein